MFKNSFVIWGVTVFATITLITLEIYLGSAKTEAKVRQQSPASQTHSAINHPQLTTNSAEFLKKIRNNPPHSQQEYNQLQNHIRNLSAHKRQPLITEILRSGSDINFSLPAIIGPDSQLSSAPSLRILLLDELATMDGEAAYRLARELLERVPVAHDAEWAILLRNYFWGSSQAKTDAFFIDHFAAFFAHLKQNQTPSPLALEGLDAIPAAGLVEYAPELHSLIRSADSSEALTHAAFIALEKLVHSQPLKTIQQLQDENYAGSLRAAFYAHLDPRRSQERQMISQFLNAASTKEQSAFFAIFPASSQFVGNHLFGETKITPLKVQAQRDFAALQFCKESINSTNINPEMLNQARQHLELRVADAINGGFLAKE